jgi:hypothetical protein
MAKEIWGRSVQRSLAGRLEKLERRHKPNDGAFFVVWAADQAGIDKAITSARAALMFGVGDIVIAAVWPHETAPRPATRWVLKRERLPEAAADALTGLMVQHVLAVDADTAVILLSDDKALTEAIEAEQAKHAPNPRRAAAIEFYTDTELFAAALGRRAA